jgi:hypothetical protein
MTPKKKQSLFTEPMTPASSGSELAFLVQNAAILEAQLSSGDSSGYEGLKAEPSETIRSVICGTTSTINAAIGNDKGQVRVDPHACVDFDDHSRSHPTRTGLGLR